ncbi:MAG TPA: ribonuclease D [Arenicellales bacterium]|nr:ribonuclease D [Arenicellales bacterium]
MPHELIDTQTRLDETCRRLAGESAIGVDTEFLRVRTYYPKLALMQFSTADSVCCVDPLADGLRLDALWEVLADQGVLKVMHAARQDVEVLLRAAGVMPQPLFDTQIAAALVGYGDQVGYAGLVEAEFGEVLPKGSQRTDWTRRPLSEAQVGYAENDVRYLLPLRDRLESRLRELGRYEWALEDFQRVLDPGLYEPDPEQAYRRVARGAHLQTESQHALRRLCTWRENAARRRDLPRNWVLDDAAAAAIAARMPRTLSDLGRLEEVRAATVRRDGEAILECLRQPAEHDDRLWARHEPLTAAQKSTMDALTVALKKRADDLGIARSLLATRADLEKLVRGAPVEELITGWRREVIGRDLQRVLETREQRVSKAGAE